MGGGQAWSLPLRAVHINSVAAAATNQVMMVIPHAVFVSGCGACGLDTPQNTPLGENPQYVVHRLTRDRADASSDILGDFIGRGMRPLRDRGQHRQALGGHLDAVLAQSCGGVSLQRPIILEIWTKSRSGACQVGATSAKCRRYKAHDSST